MVVLIMKRTLFTFLVILQFAEAATEEPRAVCPTPEIQVAEGDAAFLLCHLDPSISLSAFTVDWKRVDVNKVVYSYRRGQKNPHDQLEQYSARTSVNHEDLSRGNMTLLISSVQLSDSGQYKCFVPKLVSSCVVDLTVVPRDQHYRTTTDGFTTAKRPHEEPDNPGGKTINIVLAVVVPAVVVCLVGVLVWIRRRKIQKCWRKLRGQREQRVDMENVHELKHLKNPLGESQRDHDGAASRGRGQ